MTDTRSERPKNVIRFDRLTPLGKGVWLAGAAVHFCNKTSTTVRRVVGESRRAFREGLHGEDSPVSQKSRKPPSG